MKNKIKHLKNFGSWIIAINFRAKNLKMIWEKLNRFTSISKYKSLSEAARQENYSQSTWSRDIAELEDVFRARLIYRNYNGIKLTEKGKNLVEIIINFKENLKNFKSTN